MQQAVVSVLAVLAVSVCGVSGQATTTQCQVSSIEAVRIKEAALGHISQPALNISAEFNTYNWYMQLVNAFDADATFVHDTLQQAGTEPPTYRLGFLFWGVDVAASSKQWHDKSQQMLGERDYPWVAIPCTSACDGDVIAGPAYFDDQADMALGMVNQYLDGIPETLTGLVERVMSMTRVAVVSSASVAGREETEKQVVMPAILSQQISESNWAFRWFGNTTRKEMYTCRRLMTNV